jgi:hypothetical protein
MAVITETLKEREKEVRPYIEAYAALFELDPNLIRALITQESRFVGNATSPTGAYGWGQFTNIGAKQVQNIARMNKNAADLSGFTKAQASDPDKGVKAICATLWWLFYVKYASVQDKKLRIEASTTFYNAGGIPAGLVVKHGSHAKAIPALRALPANRRSQSVVYTPELLQWYVAWYELMKEAPPEEPKEEPEPVAPIKEKPKKLEQYASLIEALKLLGNMDSEIDVILETRNGLTEVSLLIPGEYE